MILITGATGNTGLFLLEELHSSWNKVPIRCLVRKNSPNIDRLKKYNLDLIYGDLDDGESLKKAMEGVEVVVHIVNIRYSLKILQFAERAGVKKIIFIHTTGMYSKFRSYSIEYEEIEREIMEKCKLDYIILRPTMIYGTVLDHNMHKLINYIKNNKIFPVFGNGNGLMQPVHARDLAKAIVGALNKPKVLNKAYNISGGSVLKYKDILRLIASKVNPDVKFIHIPYGISIVLIIVYNFLMRLLGKKGMITLEQVRRLSEDKVYSYEEAMRDLGYSPISFEVGITEEIKGMG